MDLGVNYVGLGRVPVAVCVNSVSLLARIAQGSMRENCSPERNQERVKRSEHADARTGLLVHAGAESER